MKTHETQVSKLVSLKDDGFLDVTEVEMKITKALVQMHETISKLLKDNNVIVSEYEKSKKQMEMIIREVFKLQNTFVTLSS